MRAVDGGAAGEQGYATIRDSTLSGNSAEQDGGGDSTSPTTCMSSTARSAATSPTTTAVVSDYRLLGLAYSSASTTARLSTMTPITTATKPAGRRRGCHSGDGSNPRFIVVNSIIARNTIFDAPIEDDCNGVLEAYGTQPVVGRIGLQHSEHVAASASFAHVDWTAPGQRRSHGDPCTPRVQRGRRRHGAEPLPASTRRVLRCPPTSAGHRARPVRRQRSRRIGSQLPGPLLFANGFE